MSSGDRMLKLSKICVGVCAAMLCAVLIASQAHARVHTSRIGVWKITQQYDRYTGTYSCEIRTNRVRIENGLVVLRIKRQVKDDPIIRVDGLEPKRASEFLSEIRLLTSDVLDDVNSGDKNVLYLPLRLLAHADHIFIRSGVHEKIKKFELTGISQVLELSQSERCGFSNDRPMKSNDQLLLTKPLT